MELLKFIGIFILAMVAIWIFCWWLGGVHIDYLKAESPQKIGEMDFDVENCVYEGYQRSLFDGFGGRVWYLCKKDNLYYTFFFSRRINNPEIQIYNFEQRTIFPSQFGIENIK